MRSSLKRPPSRRSLYKALSKSAGLFRSFIKGKRVPDHVREKRRDQQGRRTQGGCHCETEEDDMWSELPLHALCAQDEVSLAELHDCLIDYPDAIQSRDANGRYPLHVIGDNVDLIAFSSGKQVAKAFALHLMQEFPGAIVTPDNNDFLPFCSIIADWVMDVNSDKKPKEEEGASLSVISTNYPGKVGFLHMSSKSETGYFFPRVEFWDEVVWSFEMLSAAMGVLGQNFASPTMRSTLSKKPRIDERTVLVEKLAAMPNLVRSVLLVNDDAVDSRSKVLETPVFRRLLICPLIIDKWLVRMLKHGGVPSRRGVDFLRLVSNTTYEDYTGGIGDALSKDLEAFHQSKECVFNAIGQLKGIIASLVALDTDQLERAASTSITWHIMSNKLSRPFVLGLVLIDLSLHVALMLAFRNEAQLKPSISIEGDGIVPNSWNIYIICIHYITRIFCELGSILMVSRSAFWSAFWNWWTLFDLFAVILTVVTVAVNRIHTQFHNGLNAFVVGLLWIKVLAFLKVVNKEMATFILSLTQILSDIRLFMVVLFVCVCMFGDMFHVAVNGKDNFQYCSKGDYDSSTMEDFCSSSWEAYLRTYSILLGDFELDEVTQTTGSTILFMIFTIFGVIVLLNVLIAIISDSYEKAMMSSHVLFGKARVMFVAHNDALEAFLRKPSQTKAQGTNDVPGTRSKTALKRIARWAVMFVILGSTVFTEIFLIDAAFILSGSGSEHIFMLTLCIFLAFVLFSGLWVALVAATEGQLRDRFPRSLGCIFDSMDYCNRVFVEFVASCLFGLKQGKVHVVTSNESIEQEWMGRLRYLEEVLQRLMNDNKHDLRLEMKEMKDCFDEIKIEMHQDLASMAESLNGVARPTTALSNICAPDPVVPPSPE